MTNSQHIRSVTLELMAAGGLNPIPQPLEYWRRQVTCVIDELTREETEAALTELEAAGLVTSQVDGLGQRRYWITPKGVAANNA